MIFTNLNASSWSTVGQPKEKGLFDFDFITWMAWTWPTASFFIFIALCITVMYFWEKKVPGGNPRKGILSLNTTRGDRMGNSRQCRVVEKYKIYYHGISFRNR